MPVHLYLLLSLNYVMLAQSYCFDDDVENARPKQLHVDAHGLEVLAKCGQTPLEPKVIIFRVLVLNEVFIFLVDRVVREVHEFIVFVELRSVSFRREPCQSFFIHIYSQRFIACNHNINPQVKLIPVDKQGICDIP